MVRLAPAHRTISPPHHRISVPLRSTCPNAIKTWLNGWMVASLGWLNGAVQLHSRSTQFETIAPRVHALTSPREGLGVRWCNPHGMPT
jgi:hypothetical protein